MPLTLAHPAAVLPLHRRLGRWTVLSALVIGSMMPDFAYVMPASITRDDTHSLAALLWFCLPVGAAVYFIFHLVLKRPLLSLAPPDVGRRLSVLADGAPRLPAVSWIAVALSLLLGAATHLAWDSFTHADTLPAHSFAFLRATLFTVGLYQLTVYKLLQHVSTFTGIFVLYWWCRRWLRESPVGPEPSRTLTRTTRLASIAALLAIPAAYGLAVAVSLLSHPSSVTPVQIAVGRGVVSSLTAFGASLLAFGAWWHLWSHRFQAEPGRPAPRPS